MKKATPVIGQEGKEMPGEDPQKNEEEHQKKN